jgi:hypothetical protein
LCEHVISSTYSTSKREIPNTSIQLYPNINQHGDKTWNRIIIADERKERNTKECGEGEEGVDRVCYVEFYIFYISSVNVGKLSLSRFKGNRRIDVSCEYSMKRAFTDKLIRNSNIVLCTCCTVN